MATLIIQSRATPQKTNANAYEKVFSRLQEVLSARVYSSIEGYLRSQSYSRGIVEEIRLRSNRQVYLTLGGTQKQNCALDCYLSAEELAQIFERMCDGSLYTYSESIIKGFISIGQGIRVGVCGRASVEDGRILGIYDVSALNLRLPHLPLMLESGLFDPIAKAVSKGEGVLIFSPPAQGKTTVLRSLCSRLSAGEKPMRIALVDSRDELFAFAQSPECSVDVLSGYPKEDAIYMATAFMNPQLIICDEIGSEKEARAIASAQNCGVPLIASAHGDDVVSLLRRPSMLALHQICAFGLYVGIRIAEGGRFSYVMHTRKEVQDRLENGGTDRSSF